MVHTYINTLNTLKSPIYGIIRLYKVLYTTYKRREELSKVDKMFLENECLQLKTKLGKIGQMNWWERIVFIFKGEFV